MAGETYDPGLVVINFRGQQLTGFAAGTFINVERAVDGVGIVVGADGEYSRSRSRNKSGSVTLTLRAESPTNDVLTAAYLADEQRLPVGRGPLTITDLGGTSRVSGMDAWIRKLPASGFAAESGTREWVFDIGNLDIRVGGNFL